MIKKTGHICWDWLTISSEQMTLFLELPLAASSAHTGIYWIWQMSTPDVINLIACIASDFPIIG